MELFGTTRSRVERSHALIGPDSFVTSDLPGWERSQCIILISPRMGAQFSQYLALMEEGGFAGPASRGVERVLYVVEGGVDLILRARPPSHSVPVDSPIVRPILRSRCGRQPLRASMCSKSGT